MAETVSFSEIVTRTLHPDWIEENISADSILLEVRMNLLDIATVEECTLPKAES